jgi:Phosphatidylinositol-specific phospholipase C, X domain
MGRNAKITIVNNTGYDLSYVSDDVIHGKFQEGKAPPKSIKKDESGTFEVGNITGWVVGPKGLVTYKLTLVNNIDLELKFFWNHPFSASTSTYEAFSNPGPCCAYYLQPAHPVGHNQELSIVVSLTNLSNVYNIKKWMSAIDESVNIANLNIPGTHDSCALHGGPPVQCQTMSLKQQFESGIRFIDIRCKLEDDVLKVYHGDFYQEINLDAVIDACDEFLHANDSECIMVSIKNEVNNPSGENKARFDAAVRSFIGNQTKWYVGQTTPSLKDAKGKKILLRRFPSSVDTSFGIDASDWPDNKTFWTDGDRIRVQDNYVVVAGEIGTKWTHAKAVMEEAQRDQGSKLFINFMSGSTAMNPIDVAEGTPGDEGMNDRLYSYVSTLSGRNKLGIMPMDFPEYPLGVLISTLIGQNHLKITK